MAFSGGTFSRTFDCTTDRDNGVKILASKFDTELDGFATGLSTCILKDGTQTCTAAIPFAEGLTVPDNKTIVLGTNSDITIQYDESTNDSLEIAANVEGAALGIVLKADQGDDNADQHKLNIADGGTLTLGSKISGSFVSYLTHTPNSTVASSTTAVAGNLTVGGDLTLGSGAVISEAELEAIDGVTAGTVAASKAVIVDSNKDIASFRNVTLTGELDAGSLDISGDADIDGTLEADAMTLNGTAITATATLDTGISNNNVPKFTSGVADDDFLRVAGTAIEGRSASEVLSDIAALPLAGGSMTGAVTITTADNNAQLTLKSTDADGSVGPVFDLVRDSASPADGDSIGQIKYIADNDAGEATTYSSAFTTLRDASDGAEDGQVINYVITGGSLVDHLRMGRGSANGQSEVTINEGSADIDFRVESNGNANMLFVDASADAVGIGTASPATAGVGLHVQTSSTSISDTVTADVQAIFERNGNAGIAIVSGASSIGSLKFGAPGDLDGGRIVYSQSEDSMRFLTADQERIRITSTGRLGVGTSAPAHNVEIVATNAGSVNDSLQIRNNATSSGTGSRIRFINSTDENSDANGASIASVRNGNDNDLVFETENSEAMRIDASGRLLIGDGTANAAGSLLELQTAQNTANVLYMLKTNQVEMTMGFKSSTDTNFYIGTGSSTIGTNGVFLSNTGNSFSSVSDERKKTVIEQIENASAKVSTLRTVIGRFNHDEDDQRRPFLMAQDVQAVLPEAVSELPDEDGTLGLSYTDVIPLLTAALKESIAKIEDLETRLAALEGA